VSDNFHFDITGVSLEADAPPPNNAPIVHPDQAALDV
jgi:hypothetical protein